MRLRTVLVVVFVILTAIVIQTTLFGRVRVVTPDLVMLVSILFALTRLRTEAVLGLAFVSGLVIDLLGSSLLGLRAIVFTVVAYIAIRTRERAEIGRLATALWVGVLTIVAHGPYRFTRNPLYLVMATTYIGITVSVNTVWPLLFVPVVLVLISLVIRQEERYLEGKFGQEYLNYKAKVRRWL